MSILVLAFVAKLRHFSQHDSANETLAMPELIGKVWSFLEDVPPVSDGMKVLENRVNTIAPINLSFSDLVVSVVHVS